MGTWAVMPERAAVRAAAAARKVAAAGAGRLAVRESSGMPDGDGG